MKRYLQLKKKQIQFKIACFVSKNKTRFFLFNHIFFGCVFALIIASWFYNFCSLSGVLDQDNQWKILGFSFFIFIFILVIIAILFNSGNPHIGYQTLTNLGCLPENKHLIYLEIESLNIKKEQQKLDKNMAKAIQPATKQKIYRHKI